MVKRLRTTNPTRLDAVATDEAALTQLAAALHAVGLREPHCTRLSKGWKGAAALGRQVSDGVLLLTADEGISPAVLSAVREIGGAGGMVGVWTGAEDPTGTAPGEQWIGEQLLFQEGAVLSPYLAPLAVALRLHRAGVRDFVSGVSLQGKQNAVWKRLSEALSAAGFETRSGKKGFALVVDAAGNVFPENRDIDVALGEPKVVVEGMKLLAGRRGRPSPDIDAYPVSREDVDLIAQPPPRLLSEIASKKLFAAFGLLPPFEQLCRSPSEAARVAAGRPGTCVMKLVKPRLENKQDAGAVLLGIEGTAAARRAAQVLDSLGTAMGPPEALGVLTAEEISGGLRLSLRMLRHPRFGRLVVIEKGDRPSGRPCILLRAPVDANCVCAALRREHLSSDENAIKKIGVAVSRFSEMIGELKGRICRAEIHPLVAADAYPDALVLDALAEVGPD